MFVPYKYTQTTGYITMAKTYRDIISDSLRLLGVIGQGQEATGKEAHDALGLLEELFDTWNSTDIMLYQTSLVELPLVSGQMEYTIGPESDIEIAVRPTQIQSAYIRTGGTETEIRVISHKEHGSIADKSVTSSDPYYVYFNTGWPVGTLSIYPIPSGDSTLIIHFESPLPSTMTLDTEVNLPPAYRGAIRYNLAIMLAPEYGKELPLTVYQQASDSIGRIQRANFKSSKMKFDIGCNGHYDIMSDSYR